MEFKQRNNTIDALKVLAMIAVVFTHAIFPGNFGEIVWAYAQFAVPVFFMISGYFMFGADSVVLLNRAKKTLVLALATSAVYLFYSVLIGNVDTILSDVTLETIVKLLVLSSPAFGLPVHLWYLYASVLCYLVFAALFKFHFIEKLSKFLPLLIVFTIFVGILLPEFEIFPLYETLYRNAFLMGIPFMALGYEIRRLNQIKDYKKSIYYFPMLLGLLITIVENYLYRFSTLRIGSAVFILISLFILATKSKVDFNLLSVIGKKYSRDVYIWHVLVLSILRPVLSVIGIYSLTLIRWLFPILALLITLVLAVLLDYIRSKFALIKKKG